jgi:MoaA/NifB/PqqE/SkfB family radical SAM enzyme
MPGASISYGHNGPLQKVRPSEVEAYLRLMRLAASSTDCFDIARLTMADALHVVEFWMPGECNLHCKHCYVASTQKTGVLTESEYAQIARQMIGYGLVDFVVPGMEPLLRAETWPLLRAAKDAGARSIGMTTNGTLLRKRLGKVLESPLTVMNVSIDGPQAVHDDIRGKGVFKSVMSGIRALRAANGQIRLVSNCTVSRLNAGLLNDTAKQAFDAGFSFAAFHPFERSAEIDNSQEVSAHEVADSFEELRNCFEKGALGSIALEAEASRMDVLLELFERGWFVDMELVRDESGFLFYGLRRGDAVFLVNIMSHPHHFIRTIRVADDGGLSSCRGMAKSNWAGIGDLRTDAFVDLISSDRAIRALADIWSEFKQAQDRSTEESLCRFLRDVEDRHREAPPAATRNPLEAAYC